MADDPKKPTHDNATEGGDDPPAKKPYAGESQDSVTKIERRKNESSPPKSEDDPARSSDGSIEKAAAKAAEDAKSGDDEPTWKPPSVRPLAKKSPSADESDDVEPTGAHRIISVRITAE